MKKFRQILIIDLKTIVVASLAVASTYLCRRFEITADFPMTLIATAVVFPIVFSIGRTQSIKSVRTTLSSTRRDLLNDRN